MPTGYETHLDNFKDLLKDCFRLMKRYLADELDLQLRSKNKEIYILDKNGNNVEIEQVHCLIQADVKLQREVYNIWMTTYH
ncbi:MAG: hypothetical protein P1Q69_09185 [Candidatus Thorarchaeota archaeon]|nr:hypothetical protein [Candidatus Thorarchaeota archaeon]